MTAIKGVVFDKDGTLYDFNATWGAWTLGLLTEEVGDDPARLAKLADVMGYDVANRRFRKDSIVIASTASEVADAIMPYLPPQPKAELIARMNARAATAPQVEAAPLADYLDGLRGMCLKLGVATNDAEAPARAHLAASHVVDRFDFIAGYDSGFGGKPEAGQLIAFCEATGLAPEACVMVGDSTHDLHAGRAAGMRTVAVLTGLAEAPELAPHADVVLPSIAELPTWIVAQG